MKPGQSAQRKFLTARRRWWRRVGGPLRIFLTVVMVLGLAGSVLPGIWAWVAGVGFGCGFALFLELRDAPPGHIENWRRGADGERHVAKILKPLREEGWHLFHDIPTHFGNIDHLIIGRPGVFLIETKNWQGTKTINRDQVSVTFIDEPDSSWSTCDLGPRVRAASADRSEVLREATWKKPWVQGVVALCGEFPQGAYEFEKVTYVRANQLRHWLQDRTPALSAERVAELAQATRDSQRIGRHRAGIQS